MTKNTCGLYTNGSNPRGVSGHDSGSLNEELQNSDDIKACNPANKYLFGVLRLTTTGAARSVLLKFERKNGQLSDGKQARLALKNKYQNTSRQLRRTLLRRLDSSVMRSDIDPDVFFSQVFQLRDEFNDSGEVVSNERLATTGIILDALPEEMYSTIKVQPIRDPDLRLDEIMSMMKTIFINHSERSSVPKRSQESYRKSRDSSGREPRMNGREPAMATVITCHNCTRLGHKMKTSNT